MKKRESGKYKFITSKRISIKEVNIIVEHIIDPITRARKFVRKIFKRVDNQPFELDSEEVIKDEVKSYNRKR